MPPGLLWGDDLTDYEEDDEQLSDLVIKKEDDDDDDNAPKASSSSTDKSKGKGKAKEPVNAKDKGKGKRKESVNVKATKGSKTSRNGGDKKRKLEQTAFLKESATTTTTGQAQVGRSSRAQATGNVVKDHLDQRHNYNIDPSYDPYPQICIYKWSK
ncbi:hypothetical protein IWX49DRAFT_593238 [Phyllosticta citricarpa]|uniref:Uncharacterized protein n=2 Tax=Phyllosticta TaxID=121621 RepID=A0ABR1MH26_9PEZI